MRDSNTPKRAVGYTRVSTEKQATEEKVSLEEQRKDIGAHCALRGYEIVDWYSDVGSGASKRRRDYQRMLKDAPIDKYDIIVAWKSDRLSRGTYPATALIEAIEATDIELEAVKDTIDRDTFELYAWVGKRELKAISERSRMGHRGRAKTGVVSGVAKFGYKLVGKPGKKRPEIYEPEAELVRRIFAEYISGIGSFTIAQNLRKDGITTRHGSPFNPTRVWDTIKDPVYIGKGYYGRTQTFKRDNGEKDVRILKATDKDTWIEVPYPAIIDEETFQKAQVNRKNQVRQRKQVKYNVNYMLRGLIWCGDCDKRYSTSTSKSVRKWVRADGTVMRRRKKNPDAVYMCYNAVQHGARCSKPRIGRVGVDNNIWNQVHSFLTHPGRVKTIIEERQRQLDESGTIPELDKASKQLQKLSNQESKAVDLYLEGDYDKGYLDAKINDIRDSKAQIELEIKRLERESSNASETIERLSNFVEAAGDISSRLGTMTEAERTNLVQSLIERVTVRNGELDVVMALDFGVGVTHGTNARP